MKIRIILVFLLCLFLGVTVQAQIDLQGNYGLSFGNGEQPINIAIPTAQKVAASATQNEISPPEVRVDPIVIQGDHLIKFNEEYRKTFPKGHDFGAKFTLSNAANKIVIHCLVPTPRDIQSAKNKGALMVEGCIIPYHHLEDTKQL